MRTILFLLCYYQFPSAALSIPNSDEVDNTYHGRYNYGRIVSSTSTITTTITTTHNPTTQLPIQLDGTDKTNRQKSIVELNANLTFATAAQSISTAKKVLSNDAVVLHKYEDLKYVQQRKGLVAKILKQRHLNQTAKIRNLTYDDIQHAKDQNLFFSGDLFLTPNQLDTVVIDFLREKNRQKHNRNKREITQSFIKKWPLTIPYLLDDEAESDDRTKEAIKQALEFWQSHTCINFELMTNISSYKDFLVFDRAGGCSSFKGRIGGPQPLHIGANCERFGVVSHEIGHALGLWHHHQRYDRDEFIVVLWDQIRDDRIDNFFRCATLDQCDNHNVPYDYGSVMHYPAKAFSIAEQLTLVPQPQFGFVNTIGSREFGPSFYDVLEVNRNYCEGLCGATNICSNGGYLHPKNCSKCLCPDPFTGDFCDSVLPGSPDKCGSQHKLIAGAKAIEIESPNYPKLFQSGQSCSWLFEVSEDTRVQMEFSGHQFSFVQADSDPLCYATFVEIRNSTDLSNTGIRYCGYEKPEGIITSMSNRLIVLLRSVPEAFDFGFRAKIWAIRASDLCFNSISNWVFKVNSDPLLPKFNVTKIEGVTHSECQNICRNSPFCSSYSFTEKNVPFAQCLLVGTTCAKQPKICQWNANAFYSENECHIEPVNCEMSEWSQWSNCSDKCGTGIQSRTRGVLTQSQGGGVPCYNYNSSETQECINRICTNSKVLEDPCNALPCDFNNDLCKWKSDSWHWSESNPPKNSVTGATIDADGNKKKLFVGTDSPSVSIMSVSYMLMPEAPDSVELKLCVNVSNCDCPKSPNCLWSDKFDNKTLPETPNGFIRSWRPCVKNSNLSWNCQKPKVSVSLPKFTNKLYFVAKGLSEQSFAGLDSFTITSKDPDHQCSPMTENDLSFAINSCLPESSVASTIIIGDIYRSYRGGSDPDWNGTLLDCKKLCLLETECKAMEFYSHGDEPECLIFDTTCADQQCLNGIVSSKYYENLCYKSKF